MIINLIQTVSKSNSFYFTAIVFFLSLILYSCTSSKQTETEEILQHESEVTSPELTQLITDAAMSEQENPMYSKTHDSTYLYWLDNRLVILRNQSKCNIFALNTLYIAGFKTPDVNTLTNDLMDESRFNDIFPVVKIENPDEIRQGDLLVWYGHMIIFDYLIKRNGRYYAQAWWAGTRQPDNGENIINNVIYGKYPLKEFFIVRRPVIDTP